jgi:integrase/recombinase XerD
VDLPEHAHEFVASLQAERGLSPNTASAYARDLAQYHETLSDHGYEPTEDAVRSHLEMLRARGLAATSIARKLASIRAYHRFLVVEGFTEQDPTASIDSPRTPSPIPKALTVDEAGRLVEAPNPTTPVGQRDRAILETLYATGCRVSELVGLDLHDVDLDTRSALVTGKGDKERIVPLGRYATNAIQAWLPVRLTMRRSGADPGALFLSTRGNRLSRQAVWRIVRSYGVAAHIEESRLSPHVLRHSAATHMVEGGADLRTVQEILGHASLSTTQVYTRVSPEHLREIVITSHPRGR